MGALAMVLLLCIAASAASAAPRARIVVDAPAQVRPGYPVEVRLSVAGVTNLGGYETSLFYNGSAAHLGGVEHRGNGMTRTGRGTASIGVVEHARGASFGLYTCDANCATGRGARHARGPSGRVSLANVTVIPDRNGVLRLRFANTVLVDTAGRRIPLQAAPVISVRVGGSKQIFAAPTSPWRVRA